jgi:phosphoribosyl 1,2-cyclic phosphodiesterase
MEFAVLASGSSANATVVRTKLGSILVDCGLSARETVNRMQRLGISPTELSGIIVTHGHSDHISGIEVFATKYQLPVYATEVAVNTINSKRKNNRPIQFVNFIAGSKFMLGAFEIHPFQIPHDAPNTAGLIITDGTKKIGFATDCGKPTLLMTNHLGGCDAVVLESNHDKEMLQDCDYPWAIKQRIASNHGHLSNEESAQVLFDLLHQDLKLVVLAHLSKHSNTPDHAYRQSTEVLNGYPQVRLEIAKQDLETEIFKI